MTAQVFDRTAWWMQDPRTGYPVQVFVDRLRITVGGKFYDISGHRYVRIDKAAQTVEGADSEAGPWTPAPEHADQGITQ